MKWVPLTYFTNEETEVQTLCLRPHNQQVSPKLECRLSLWESDPGTSMEVSRWFVLVAGGEGVQEEARMGGRGSTSTEGP